MHYETFSKQDAENFADQMATKGVYCEVIKEGSTYIVKEVKE